MNRQGQERAQILYAFGLSLVFVLIDWMVFTLLVEPLYRWLPIEPAWLCNAVHLTLLSLTGTLLGCLAFGAVGSRLRLVPWAYSFFPVYVLACALVAWLGLEGETRTLASNWSASIRLHLQLSAWRFPGCSTSGCAAGNRLKGRRDRANDRSSRPVREVRRIKKARRPFLAGYVLFVPSA